MEQKAPLNLIYATTPLQFENLVVNNRDRLLDLLHIDANQVVWDNPYLQKGSLRKKGCQIDYLVQTRDKCLYLCEIKFSTNPILPTVIQEVEQKISALSLPRGFSVRPVLIHVNGVAPALLAAEYFSAIVDFSEFLGLVEKGKLCKSREGGVC